VQAYQEEAVRDLQHRAVRDPLTGLYNHDYSLARIQEEVRRAHRHAGQVTLVMLDLDHFKQINDTYGHQAGDHALTHLAATLCHVARESDIVCRYAGDEFIIILPGSDRAQGCVLAERLLAALHEPLPLSGEFAMPMAGNGAPPPAIICLTLSAGVATYPDDARTPETLLAQADMALYQAKADGRDRVAAVGCPQPRPNGGI